MAVWLETILDLAPDAGADDLAAWLADGGNAAIARAAGSVWGLWDGRPGLGFASNQAVLITVWPDDAAAGAAVELTGTCPHVVTVTGTPWHPTRRPETTVLPVGGGIWVFREFHVAISDVEQFVDLSASAWESFEAHFDAKIAGLFRGPNENDAVARLLLATRYADFAAWEASRNEAGDPGAWARFRERARLTRWTRARTAVRVDAAFD